MTALYNNTAILIFSRSAQAEAKEKKLVFNPRKAEPVAHLMIKSTHRVVKSTKIPYFFFTEKKQVGHSFGERLAHAFETIFDKGFDHVIAIGNDCLSLSKTDILSAQQALNSGIDTVFGKTTDGGAYLIGLQKTTFDAAAFQQIEWKSPSVFEELLNFVAQKNLKTTCLSEKTDLDSAEQWANILNSIPLLLKRSLLGLWAFCNNDFCYHNPNHSFRFYAYFKLLRAPPL